MGRPRPRVGDYTSVPYRRVLSVALTLLVVGQTSGLDEAKALIDDLQYSKGLAILRDIVANEKLSVDERVRAFSMIATAHAARSEPDMAERAFFAAFRLDPDFAIPEGTSPKIQSAFDAARARYETVRPTGLEVKTKAEEGRVTVAGRFVDAKRLVTSVDVHRPGQDVVGATLKTAEGERTFETTLAVDGDEVRFWVSLHAASKKPLLTWGTRDDPKVITVPVPMPIPVPPPPTAEPEGAWYSKWWVWAAVAGVVAVGTTVAIVATQDDLLGRIEVP